jgi:hypothetical protein
MKKPSLVILGLCMLCVSGAGCSRTPPTAPEEQSSLVGDLVITIAVVPLDSLVVADVFGDHDGVASADELKGLGDYFTAHRGAWCVCGLSQELWQATQASGDQVRQSVGAVATRPYPTEVELRSAYAGISIKTPWVSIVQITRARGYFGTRFMRSPGPGIATATWVDLQVK